MNIVSIIGRCMLCALAYLHIVFIVGTPSTTPLLFDNISSSDNPDANINP